MHIKRPRWKIVCRINLNKLKKHSRPRHAARAAHGTEASSLPRAENGNFLQSTTLCKPRSPWNGDFPVSPVPTKGNIPDKALRFKAPVAIYMKPPPALSAPPPPSVIISSRKKVKKNDAECWWFEKIVVTLPKQTAMQKPRSGVKWDGHAGTCRAYVLTICLESVYPR